MDKDSKVIKVIKGKEMDPSTISEELNVEAMEQHGVIKGDIYSASARAREILQKAQSDAEEIIRRAVEQREKEKQDGYDAGYQEGLAQVTELLAKARTEYDASLRNASKDMLGLAFKIAEKIIGKALELDKNLVVDIVAQALQTVRQSRQITIRVNPEDAKTLRASKETLADGLGQGRMIDVAEDKKVPRGGCIIESEIGIVEAHLQTQLERLKKVLSERKAVV
ncbi:MAG TPA: type III secretion system stator protein SctL [Acidobacteriota bacterium]|nr:type III secretion system stator protein SctL [Acidobacteriota bacterium]